MGQGSGCPALSPAAHNNTRNTPKTPPQNAQGAPTPEFVHEYKPQRPIPPEEGTGTYCIAYGRGARGGRGGGRRRAAQRERDGSGSG